METRHAFNENQSADEFDFRYNSRKIEDGERSLLAIHKVTGKRLKYRY